MPLVPLWIKALIVAALLAAAIFYVNRYLSSVEQRGYDRAVVEYQAKLITAQNDAIIERNRLQGLVEAAIKGRSQREETIRKSAAATGALVTGVRNELDTLRDGLSTATVDALRHATAALAIVFGSCTERYSGLAEKADRHASDVRAMMEAGSPTPDAGKVK